MNPRNPYDNSKRVWSPDDGKTIRFRFHNTDLVEYTDDTLTITFWDSASSIVFVNELAPVDAHSYRGSMWVQRMQPVRSELLFRRVGTDYEVDLSTVAPQYKVVADRKIVARVSKQLRPFLDYRRARAALEGKRGVTASTRAHPNIVDAVEQALRSPDHWLAAYERAFYVSDSVLLRELVTRAGGIEKIPLPVGVLPVKSVYNAYAALF